MMSNTVALFKQDVFSSLIHTIHEAMWPNMCRGGLQNFCMTDDEICLILTLNVLEIIVRN